ncbi:RNase H domain-containing protein [Trichonephila clavipes]|nr:RNase H domain-containing protein [Trichonephila clavipes]
MWKRGFTDFNVVTSTPFNCITPIDSFNHVEFQEELLTTTPKHRSHPELLRQLALEIELIAISGALGHALNSYKDSTWILTYSRSFLQYLKNWPKIMDSIGLDILSKLARLGQRKQELWFQQDGIRYTATNVGKSHRKLDVQIGLHPSQPWQSHARNHI